VARNKIEGKKMDRNAWMVTFSDLLTLLLTFFVMLLTMSSMDVKKIRSAFGFFTGILGPLELGASGELTKIVEIPPLDLPINTSLFEGGIQRKNESEIEQIKAGLKGKGLEKKVKIRLEKRGLVLTFSENILFEPGSAQIKSSSISVLKDLRSVLSNSALALRIEGHTDNVPIKTPLFQSNWELSTARAINVLKYLEETGKIPPGRLSAAGYGDSKPLLPNNTAGRRARNRRVEFVLFSR
jgi:chemotaxis protein MotB